MKGWLKSQTSDKYLIPVRDQMMQMLSPSDRVIDLGCGTGDFLIKAHTNLESGLGIDGSKTLIEYAKKKAQKMGITNLSFKYRMIDQEYKPGENFSVATACLFFHVIPYESAVQILKSMTTYADRMIICAFAPPQNPKQQFLMWLDQRFTSHYRNYSAYCENGYMEGIIKKCQLSVEEITDTFDPTLKIYSIK